MVFMIHIGGFIPPTRTGRCIGEPDLVASFRASGERLSAIFGDLAGRARSPCGLSYNPCPGRAFVCKSPSPADPFRATIRGLPRPGPIL